MTFWTWTCTLIVIWIPAVVRGQVYNDDDNSQTRSRASQPKPPTVPGQGDGLPFRPGGGYKGPGNAPSASFGFNSYKGPTNGDFDSSIRKFSKTHTLGSFGNSFEGNGDHASVMNKVYNRLHKNGAGHYNREPTSSDDENSNYDQSNYNNNKNKYNPNGYNSNNGPPQRNPYQNRNYNKQSRQQQSNRDNSQSNNNYFGSSGKESSFPGLGSTHDKSMFPDDLFDFSNASPGFKTSSGGDSSGSGYNQRRQSPSPRRRTRPRGSGYRQRSGPHNYISRHKAGYYPKRGSYPTPQHLSSNYKGFGGYGFNAGRAPPRPRRPYYNPTADRLTKTSSGATLLQVTNARIPKTGEGSGYGNMVEDGGRGKAIIAITSGGSDERSPGSGGGFNYENILEDDHSLTDIVSAVATVVGQGDMNPSAMRTFSGGRGPPYQAQRPIPNNRPRHRAASGMYTGNNAYNAGPGYSGGTYVSNHYPLNNGDGGAYASNHQSLNNPGGGDGGFGPREPSLSHMNGENSQVSFEDSLQNLVF